MCVGYVKSAHPTVFSILRGKFGLANSETGLQILANCLQNNYIGFNVFAKCGWANFTHVIMRVLVHMNYILHTQQYRNVSFYFPPYVFYKYFYYTPFNWGMNPIRACEMKTMDVAGLCISPALTQWGVKP